MTTDKLDDPLDLTVFQKCFENPRVKGMSYRGAWNNIEKQRGVYNWATLDAVIAQAAANGKPVGIGIGCGVVTPQWVYDAGVEKYTLHDPHANGGSMPIPWRQNYQQILFEYIDALAAKYENNQSVVWVKIGGFMQVTLQVLGDTTDEAQLDAIAKQDGFADIRAAYDAASKAIIDRYAQKFPTTWLLLMTTNVFGDDLGGTLMKDARDYGQSTYAPRFGDQPGNGLRATLPPHTAVGTPPPYPKVAQAFLPTTAPDCVIYQPPAPSPCPLNPQATDDLIKAAALEKRDCAIEMYRGDIEFEGNQSVLDAGNELLIANMPRSVKVAKAKQPKKRNAHHPARNTKKRP